MLPLIEQVSETRDLDALTARISFLEQAYFTSLHNDQPFGALKRIRNQIRSLERRKSGLSEYCHTAFRQSDPDKPELVHPV